MTTYKIYLNNEHVQCLSKKLGDEKMQIIKQDESHTEINITLTSGVDIVDIFYTGMLEGINQLRNKLQILKN